MLVKCRVMAHGGGCSPGALLELSSWGLDWSLEVSVSQPLAWLDWHGPRFALVLATCLARSANRSGEKQCNVAGDLDASVEDVSKSS